MYIIGLTPTPTAAQSLHELILRLIVYRSFSCRALRSSLTPPRRSRKAGQEAPSCMHMEPLRPDHSLTQEQEPYLVGLAETRACLQSDRKGWSNPQRLGSRCARKVSETPDNQ